MRARKEKKGEERLGLGGRGEMGELSGKGRGK